MSPLDTLLEKITVHLTGIYGEGDHRSLRDAIVREMRLDEHFYEPAPFTNHWTEEDIALITYGDSVIGERKPLQELKIFVDKHLSEAISIVHVLPYFPWTADDGFAVSDYLSVNPSLGNWKDLEAISEDYRLMSDLVVNHCSASHEWFQQFQNGEEPGASYFVTADPADDLSDVVRPRTSPLLKEVSGRHVWCTFGHDQIDLNFKEPELLIELVKIIRAHLDRGVSIFRLDAIAFIWKEVGTPCLNLPQTHEIVRLFRTLIEHVKPDSVLITETNIPNRENLSYFGNFNEAHSIYNFSLPPLLLHALTTGTCQALRRWIMGMPPARPGTTYFNFLASHDGIGLRPTEGLLDDHEIHELVARMEENGARVSSRTLPDGSSRPYEINISLFDAFQGPDGLGLKRFVCAHAILLGLEGIPAFYIHSLLGTRNDLERVRKTGHNRHINRHQWDLAHLETELADKRSTHSTVLRHLKKLIIIRREQPAFHPNATQFSLQLGDAVFGFWRQSLDRNNQVFCLHNITNTSQHLPLTNINLTGTEEWLDLIGGEELDPTDPAIHLRPYQSIWLTNIRQHLPY